MTVIERTNGNESRTNQKKTIPQIINQWHNTSQARGKQRKRTKRKRKKRKLRKASFRKGKKIRKYSNGSPCLYILRHGVNKEEGMECQDEHALENTL